MYKPLQEDEKVKLNNQNLKGETDNLIEVHRVGDEILIERTEPDEEGVIYKPRITSLEIIPKYTNLFVCVHPFVLHGYRIHHSLKDCLSSMFTFHNETLNIWTHLVPFFAFLVLFFYNFFGKNSLTSIRTFRVIKTRWNYIPLHFHICSIIFIFLYSPYFLLPFK